MGFKELFLAIFAIATGNIVVTTEGKFEIVLFAVAQDGELDGIAGHVFANESGNGAGFTNANAVDFGDDVFVFEAGFVAWTVFDYGGIL